MRLVITKRTRDLVATAAGHPDRSMISCDSYRERLQKYIPVEIIAIYIALYGIAYAVFAYDPLFPPAARWLLIAGIVATPWYLLKAEQVTDWVQLVISTAGFFIWAAALGVVPVTDLPAYNQLAASLALPLYVFLSPLIEGIPERW